MVEHSRLGVLDGWRGISIVLVLATHLLPLGPKAFNVNVPSGVLGMVIFFVLSGFLVTSILLRKITVPQFLTRRFCRVLPIAWLYLIIALTIERGSVDQWISHLLFYANLPPQNLLPTTEHMWSLCVELQFYVGIALLFGLVGERGLTILLPVMGVCFTLLRVSNGTLVSTITYYRIDEIFAGCMLALLYHGRFGVGAVAFVRSVPQWPLLPVLAVSCMEAGWLPYLRPYLAALLIGSTLLNGDTVLARCLKWRPLAYVAAISYALYVFHPLLAYSWLGSGDKLEKYAKRPLLFAVLFCLAHLSTFYFERRWNAFGKRLSANGRPVPQ